MRSFYSTRAHHPDAGYRLLFIRIKVGEHGIDAMRPGKLWPV